MIQQDNKKVAIVINSSSPVVSGGNQEEFNFASNQGTIDGLPPIKTNFIEYAVTVPTGKSVKFIRKLNVGNISIEQPMSYKPDIFQEVVINASISGLALDNIAFTGSIVFRTSSILSAGEEVKIILAWQ